MRGVIIAHSGVQRVEYFTLHHYSWSKSLLMTLKFGQHSQKATSSNFINLVSENPSNTERVVGDSISAQCRWQVGQHLYTTLMSIAKNIVYVRKIISCFSRPSDARTAPRKVKTSDCLSGAYHSIFGYQEALITTIRYY